MTANVVGLFLCSKLKLQEVIKCLRKKEEN